MHAFRFAAVVLFIGVFEVHAQDATPDEKKHQEAKERAWALLHEPLLDTQPLKQEMPLARFLEVVQKALPKNRQLALRIEEGAFGAAQEQVAATPVMLAHVRPPKESLGHVLEQILARFKGKVDFRIDAAAITLTTPERAFFTRSYDIHDLLALPSAVKLTGAAFRNATPVEKAKRIVGALIAPIEDRRLRSGAKEPSVAIVNGTHLLINATGRMHFDIVALLSAYGRVGDCSVAIETQLLEVDRAFYAAVKNAKPVDVEEQEQKFLLKKPLEGEELYKLLPKQKKVQPGHGVRVNNGEDAALLSRAEARRCLPTPEQARKADKTPQVYFEGISFAAGVQVTADRRFTRLRLTEKSVELGQIKKKTVTVDNAGTTVDTEVPFLEEDSHTRVLEIPDGGSVLIPVVYRPSILRERDRWWIVVVRARIIIEEEERALREGLLPPNVR